MAILGGSPLGLIGVTSNPSNGYSTFNGGKTRNVAVSSYNKSKELSLFSGKRKLRAWPGINAYSGKYKEAGKDTPFNDMDTSGLLDVDYSKLRESGGKSGDNYTMSTLHNNDVYDTSVLNIIEKLAPTKAALRPSDFAYLKNLGVYPNNRLMIVRRFASPSDDNIMVSRKPTEIPSLANVISWVSDGSNFVDITFGEVWGEAKADFTNMLNRLGEDFGRKTDSMGLGDLLGAGAGAIPLPGFTEIFQRKFLSGIGLLDEKEASGIPAGNPNLIKEAKVRTTVGYGDAGSGLSAKISFSFETEYELKFISGIDPTIVWMDIIGNILRLGTSESNTYGLSKTAGAKLKKWVSNPDNLVVEVISTIKGVLKAVKDEVSKKITEVYEKATKAINDAMTEKETTGIADNPDYQLARQVAKASRNLLNGIVNIAHDVLKGTILKYRTEIIGIVNALTGAPSTPWHITIGNPLRPVFCSGDMYVQDVNLKLGPQLAFNDLPSTINVSFTITNARNLGLQEIMSKFNSGYLRTVDVQKTYYEITDSSKEAIGGLPWESAPQTDPPDNKANGTKSADGNKKTDAAANSTNSGGGSTSDNKAGANATGGNPPVAGNQNGGNKSTKAVNGKQAKPTINKNVKTPQKK